MAWLKQRLSQKEALILPGAFDALSAKLIELAGFEACYCSGFATSAGAHGLPDLGLLGLAEMSAHYKRISDALTCPLIVDADTGFGGLLNLERTLNHLSEIGIVACHIEDQCFPKRCGHMSGKSVVSRQEAISRIKMAVSVGSIDIIARTDAVAVLGFEEAITRANLFFESGATAIFIDAPKTRSQIERIPRLCDGPVLFNAAPIGDAWNPTTAELIDMGYRVVLHPIETLLASANAVLGKLQAIQGGDRIAGRLIPLDFTALNSLLKSDSYLLREQQFSLLEE